MFDALLKDLKNPEDISGPGGILARLHARCIDRALEAELELDLSHRVDDVPAEDQDNRRNGRTRKGVRTKSDQVRIQMPRDRHGTFEPKLVPKHARKVGDFDEAILGLYARGMSQRDICRFMEESYGVDIDRDVISRATDAVSGDIRLWQKRPLESTYLVVRLDAVTVKSVHNHSVENRVVYIAVGLTNDGGKDVLGIWFQETQRRKVLASGA